MSNEKLSAEKIFQRAAALRAAQFSQSRNGDQSGQLAAQIEVLQSELSSNIALWGGLTAVDVYLTEHDPRHSRLADIQGLDWSWLGLSG